MNNIWRRSLLCLTALRTTAIFGILAIVGLSFIGFMIWHARKQSSNVQLALKNLEKQHREEAASLRNMQAGDHSSMTPRRAQIEADKAAYRMSRMSTRNSMVSTIDPRTSRAVSVFSQTATPSPLSPYRSPGESPGSSPFEKDFGAASSEPLVPAPASSNKPGHL